MAQLKFTHRKYKIVFFIVRPLMFLISVGMMWGILSIWFDNAFWIALVFHLVMFGFVLMLAVRSGKTR